MSSAGSRTGSGTFANRYATRGLMPSLVLGLIPIVITGITPLLPINKDRVM